MIALLVVAGGVITAAPALAGVFDDPSRASRTFTISSVYGPCSLGGTVDAVPSPAGVGTVTTATWTDCGALSITPRLEWVVTHISGTGTTPANGAEGAEQVCTATKWCSVLHSRRLLPPGEYTGLHRISVDLTQGGTSTVDWLSYPADCAVRPSDKGYITCEFEQTVAYMPVTLPALPPLP